MEGVMMKAPRLAAVAMRQADGRILVERIPLDPLSHRIGPFKWPFVRGVVHLLETLVLGLRVLQRSAEVASGETLSKGENVFSVLLALLLAVGLFMALPAWGFMALSAHVSNTLLLNGLEALMRLTILIGYLWVLGRFKDVQRLFAYHGAEHQAIAAYEAGRPLLVTEARAMSPLHPRCGTSFLLLTVIVSLVVYALFGATHDWGWRILSKLLLLPVVAGIAYEMIRLAGQSGTRPHDPLVRLMGVLSAPGLWLQRLTTRPPDDQQLEVALAALEAARQAGLDPIAV